MSCGLCTLSEYRYKLQFNWGKDWHLVPNRADILLEFQDMYELTPVSRIIHGLYITIFTENTQSTYIDYNGAIIIS